MMTAAVRSALVLTLLCTAAVARAQTKQSAPMKIGDDQIGHEFRPPAVEYNYDRRVVMVPMHDGIKLFTIIFVPKGAHDAPIMLTRTPYNAAAHVRNHSGHPLARLWTSFRSAMRASSKTAISACTRMCAASTDPRVRTL